MFRRARSLLRITAVRLSLVYTVIFGLVAVNLVAYMTFATINVLRQQYEISINEEVQGLALVYRQRGLRALIMTLERRSRAPGANLYLVTSPSGEILGGNVPWIEDGVMDTLGWYFRPVQYKRFGDTSNREYRAFARVIQVPNGLKILVGRDVRETEQFRSVVRRSFSLALGTMVALGLLTWFFVGRRALKRIDQVSQSSMRIMGGDRSERLPISGSGDEFDRLSANLNQMLDRIDSLDEGLKQMSDNIAHDLKTPITRLRNKAEEALSVKSDVNAFESVIEDIIADSDQIVRTFNALLMISRVESGSSVAKMVRLDASTILRDVHELYEVIAEEEGIELRLTADSPLKLFVLGNRELLSQAISNLIDNAIKYGKNSNSEPTISMSVSLKDSLCRFEITDNGPGIPEQDQERAKKRFVRLDESRNRSGNGLGLSLVEAIARMHHGTLEFEDNQPGLRAAIELPIIEGEEDG